MKTSKKLIGLLGLALLVRLALLFFNTESVRLQQITEGGDAIGYTQLAHNLLTEQAFKFQDGGPTAYRMPGYPLFLAAVFSIWHSPFPAQIAQILVDLLTILIVYKTGMKIIGTSDMSLLAAAFVAFNPLIIVSSIFLLPETLSIFFISLATYFLIRCQNSYRDGLWAAIALTFCIYLKPTFAPVAIVLLLTFSIRWCFSHPINWKTILAVLLPFLTLGVLLMPWIVRNLLVMRHFIPLTTSSGSNLYGGNNPQADGGFVSSEPYVLPGMSEVESDRVFTDRATNWIKQNPVDFLRLLPAKTARFFWPFSFGTSGSVSVPAIVFWPLVLVTIFYHTIVVYGIWILLATNKQYWEGLMLAESLAMLLLLSLIAFGAVRFALPGFPASAILLSIGIKTIIHRTKIDFRKFKNLKGGVASVFLFEFIL